MVLVHSQGQSHNGNTCHCGQAQGLHQICHCGTMFFVFLQLLVADQPSETDFVVFSLKNARQLLNNWDHRKRSKTTNQIYHELHLLYTHETALYFCWLISPFTLLLALSHEIYLYAITMIYPWNIPILSQVISQIGYNGIIDMYYSLVNYHNYGKSPLFMGKSTINDHFQ